MDNTKKKGNKAEAVILAEFVKNNIPVCLPFGDNEKYDLVIEINGVFKSVQIKYGRYINGCVVSDMRHRIGSDRIAYSTYNDKVDILAVWCQELNKCYLIILKDYGNKIGCRFRIEPPKNNSSITTVVWAKDYEFDFILKKILSE